MVRRPALKLALLGALVLVSHVLALEWLGRHADAISGMPEMAATMYTRLLKPSVPPPVAASAEKALPLPRARIAPRPTPPASAAKEAQEAKEAKAAKEPEPAPEPAPEATPEIAAAAPEPDVAQAPAPAASEAPSSEPLDAATAPTPAASAPVGVAATDAGSLDTWPTDTRLTYQLSGEFRGPLFGDARVQWQRDKDKYQVRMDVAIQLFGTQVFTSQGEVTPQGLLPRAYEELRPGKRRTTRLGDEVVTLDNGRTVPRPAGVQDTASQFVELSHRFATGQEVLETGRAVTVWLARPGAVEQWTYDVVAREILQTPKLGPIEAFHLKPRPMANPRGNITAEIWFAPGLLYLPVKIRVVMGNEAHLDLLVDHIEQR